MSDVTRANLREMTEAEFKAYWDGQRDRLDRVSHRALLYGIVPAALGTAGICEVLLTLGMPVLPWCWTFLIVGAGSAKLGRIVAWRREGGKPYWLK